MASSGLKPFAVLCAEPSSRGGIIVEPASEPASEEAMERSAKHSNDGEEAGVSRRSFLGGASAVAVGSAMCENTTIVGYAAAEEPSGAEHERPLY